MLSLLTASSCSIIVNFALVVASPSSCLLQNSKYVSQDPIEHWESGVDFEIDFWTKEIEKMGKSASLQEWSKRPFQLQDKLISSRDPEQVNFNVLDVGSGPVPALGGNIQSLPGSHMNLTATDPLADMYKTILVKNGISSPFPVTKMMAEDLVKHFQPNYFDMAYSRNALDHAKDPMLVIQGLVDLVKPRRKVVVITFVNEGTSNHGKGFHQWNFANVNGSFILWRNNGTEVHDVAAELGMSVAGVECDCCNQATRTSMEFSRQSKKMACTITKA